MIDTPVTAKFFKKLELYLELKRQDKRVKKSESERGENIWAMEKSFLLWAIKGHWHMGTPLNFEHVKKALSDAGFSNDWTKYSEQIMQNLVFKKFARFYPEGEKTIQITNEGFLMAEIIEDANSKMKGAYIVIIIFILAVAFFELLDVLIISFKDIF